LAIASLSFFIAGFVQNKTSQKGAQEKKEPRQRKEVSSNDALPGFSRTTTQQRWIFKA
jgi:hypothetical protein